MSSFEQPTIPGPDRQEMPYSIVLDSVNGGTLQFASDDRVSQAQVLKSKSEQEVEDLGDANMLQDYRTHIGLGRPNDVL